MNEVSEKNNSEPKTEPRSDRNLPLKIIGIIVLIIFIAWFSVKLVNYAPSAFSSLASTLEAVNRYEDSFVKKEAKSDTNKKSEVGTLPIITNVSLAKPGQVIPVSWPRAEVSGSYTFSYECSDGVSISIVENDGQLRDLECSTNYNLGDTDNLKFKINSDQRRYADVKYTVSFLKTDSDTPNAQGTSLLTVFNKDIKDVVAKNTTKKENTTDHSESDGKATGEETGKTDRKNTDSATDNQTPVSKQKNDTYKQEFIYAIPASDPNGRIDLAVRFLNSGKIVGDTFFPEKIKQNENGAVQIEVRNLGTKTSGKWNLEMNLPEGGTYKLTEQAPLRPSEKAVITIGFPTGKQKRFDLSVIVTEPNDYRSWNNRLEQPLYFLP